MRTDINCIVFEFDPKCKGCGEIDEDFTEPVRVTIVDIIEAGVPICQHCGDDMGVLDDCEVRA